MEPVGDLIDVAAWVLSARSECVAYFLGNRRVSAANSLRRAQHLPIER